jgi:transcriptional regulator with XRE-family HTH domain
MKLAEYRKAQGLTLSKMASSLGVSEGAMSRYETGKRSPSWQILERLKAITDGAVQPNDFFELPDSGKAAEERVPDSEPAA